MERTLVIGDIHGGLRALEQLLERTGVTPADTFIFLGDYVDGWSESAAVIDFLLAFATKQRCIFIRGNHDELLLDWLLGKKAHIDLPMWVKHGGESTIKAYQEINGARLQSHITFLENLQDYYLDEKDRLFIHAGFTNMHGVSHEYFAKMFYWDRTLWETALSLDPKFQTDSYYYPKRFLMYREIFIGHTPVTRIGQTVPVQKANIWNVDTGAAFTGPLTALDADSKQYWQSDLLPDLYPGEKGRN